MFKICDLILADSSISLPIINLETKNYDIYGVFEATVTVLLEQQYDIYKICGKKCSIGIILTGFINNVSNISIDRNLFSINIISGLSLLFSYTLTEQKIFPKSTIQEIFSWLSKEYFSVTSLFNDKKDVLISPGDTQVIMNKLLNNYHCKYIFLGQKNELLLFKDFNKYEVEQFAKATHLSYKFNYDINNYSNHYFSHQNLGPHLCIETNNLNIIPGNFIILDNNNRILFVKSIIITNNINKLLAVELLSIPTKVYPRSSHIAHISIPNNSNINTYDVSGIKTHAITYGASNNWGTHIRLKSKQDLLVIKSDLVTQDIYSPGTINKSLNAYEEYLLHYKRKKTLFSMSKNITCYENSIYKFSIKSTGISMSSKSGSLFFNCKQYLLSSKLMSEQVINYRINSKQIIISANKISINTEISKIENTGLYLNSTRELLKLSSNRTNLDSSLLQAKANNIYFESQLTNLESVTTSLKAKVLSVSTPTTSAKFENKLLSIKANLIIISAATIACSTIPPKMKI